MSGTMLTVKQRVRNLCHDNDPSSRAFVLPELESAINGAIAEVAPSLYLGRDWSNAGITLVAGTSDYTLPGSQQYEQAIAFRLDSQGVEVPVVSQAEFDLHREGNTSSGGNPQVSMLIESAAQGLQVRFYPTPSRADTVSLLRALVPADLTTDAGVVPFDQYGLEAVAFRAAAILIGAASEATLERLDLSPASGRLYAVLAGKQEKASRIRAQNLRAVGGVKQTRRW